MSRQARRLYQFGTFRLDTAERQLLRNGEPVPLTPKAFEMLVLLVERNGHLVEKEELMKTLWLDSFVEEANLTNNVWTLRKILGADRNGQRYIETVPKRGYRFIASVRELPNACEELVVEKHTLTRIVTEEEETREHGDAETQRGEAPLLVPESPRLPVSTSSVPVSLITQLKSHPVGLIAVTTAALLMVAGSFLWLKSLRGVSHAPKPEMTIERLTNGGYVYSATLSPDGKYFVYVEGVDGVSHLWLKQTEQSNPIEIIPPTESAITGTTFSPDGQVVYFVTRDKQDPQGALFRVPTLGGPRTKLLTGIKSPVAFSPDGKQIAFTRDDNETQEASLIIAAADGSNERVLLMRKGVEGLSGGGPSWSPDGRQIACGLFTGPTSVNDSFCTIIGVEAENGMTKPLTEQKWDNCGRIAWSGDGRGFVLIGTKQGESRTVVRDQVWYVSQPGGEVHRITTDLNRYNYESLGLTANSNSLLVIPFSRSSQIWSMAANGDSRTAIQITLGTSDGRAGIGPLPDGRLVFVRRTGDHVDLWQMKADGTEQKQLTTDPPFLEEASATPDGRYLIFASNRKGHSHLFRVDADGANLKQLSDGDSIDLDSDISPDGRWIVYESHPALKDKYLPPSLWKISIEGGTPVRLTEQEASSPHFSPDGRYISYVYIEKDGQWKPALISAEGGAPIKTFDAGNSPLLNVGCRFTPDGQALTYIVIKKSAMNIWLQPLDGSAPRPLTDFTSGEIYNYAFSHDGSRLFLARGYDIHDAILIKNFTY